MLAADGSQVGAHHGEVYVLERPDSLQLDDDGLRNVEVHPMQADLAAAVDDRHAQLPLEGDVLSAELKRKGVLVYPFDESWPKRFVNLDRGTDDLPRQLFVWKVQVLALIPGFLASLEAFRSLVTHRFC